MIRNLCLRSVTPFWFINLHASHRLSCATRLCLIPVWQELGVFVRQSCRCVCWYPKLRKPRAARFDCEAKALASQRCVLLPPEIMHQERGLAMRMLRGCSERARHPEAPINEDCVEAAFRLEAVQELTH